MKPEPRPHLNSVERPSVWETETREGWRLDMNEVGIDLPDALLDLVFKRSRQSLKKYPSYAVLYRKLSEHLKVPRESLLLTNGSDGGASLVFQTYCRPGDTVALTEPTFAMHRVYAELGDAKIVTLPYTRDLKLPMDGVLSSLQARPRILVLITPNHPTGAVISADQATTILLAAEKTGTLVFFDEAYVEMGGDSHIELAARHPNAIVSRTFSKAFSIPGARLGYLVAAPPTIQNLRKPQPTFDVNQFAVELGLALLEDPGIIVKHVAEVDRRRQWLTDRLSTLSLKTLPSKAGNFVVVEMGTDVSACRDFLAARGVHVSSGFKHESLKNCLRISLGPQEGLEACLGALKLWISR